VLEWVSDAEQAQVELRKRFVNASKEKSQAGYLSFWLEQDAQLVLYSFALYRPAILGVDLKLTLAKQKSGTQVWDQLL
jgi:hypothetical protein